MGSVLGSDERSEECALVCADVFVCVGVFSFSSFLLREFTLKPAFYLDRLPVGGIAAFGPLIIQGFGFNSVRPSIPILSIHLLHTKQFDTTLFNMPFGAIAIIAIFGGAWLTNKIRLRFAVLVYVSSSFHHTPQPD